MTEQMTITVSVTDIPVMQEALRLLGEACAAMREHAATVGPQHAWWDLISEIEALAKKAK